MKKGDKTIIGGKGTQLTISQKMRITLARAFYADAEIYLLDDPLSFIEPEIAERIFYLGI